MEITAKEKTAQLEKVLHCQALHGSETLRAFLRFIGTKAIDGQENHLKEYVIATEVFGRGKDFDSRIDSLVRVQAGRLRSKLLEYYATEGKEDRVLIDLPKGHYIPSFSIAAGRFSDRSGEAALLVESTETIRLISERQAIEPLWAPLMRMAEPVLVVFSNTIFHGNYEEGMKLFNSFNAMESAAGSGEPAWNIPADGGHDRPIIDHYTGIGEVMGVHFLGDFFAQLRYPYRVKRSLALSWDDAKVENIIVLGSPAENLFLLDLPRQQDFVFCWKSDDQQRPVNAIVNSKPQPGGQEVYLAKHYGNSPSQISEDYAVISLLPGLSEKNRFMILAGINTFGTQAAAEYVTQPEYIKDLITHLNLAPAGETPRLPEYFQVLIKVKVNSGVPIQVSYVTHHVLSQ